MAISRTYTASIDDQGDFRRITITERHLDRGVWRTDTDTFTSAYSTSVLTRILSLRADQYFKDELDRETDAAYLYEPLKRFLAPAGSLHTARILDFGAGTGASSIILARLGAAQVDAYDIDATLVSIGRERIAETPYAQVITYHEGHNNTLPFPDERYDIVLAYGVFEHIPFSQRRQCLTQIWRVLRPGGYVFVLDTPNRLWPIDSHTTGLPLLPYLPVPLARAYADRFSRRTEKSTGEKHFISMGAYGITYWEIKQAMPNGHYVPNEELEAFTAAPHAARRKRIIKNVLFFVYRILQYTICPILRVPVTAFLPSLNICMKKNNSLHRVSVQA